jgi:hypothetical protein
MALATCHRVPHGIEAEVARVNLLHRVRADALCLGAVFCPVAFIVGEDGAVEDGDGLLVLAGEWFEVCAYPEVLFLASEKQRGQRRERHAWHVHSRERVMLYRYMEQTQLLDSA